MSTTDRAYAFDSLKRRPRRDGRRNETAVRASLNNVLESKAVTKNPTRFIPDASGFCGLSKTEVKRDTKEIERNSLFSSLSDSDSDEELERAIPRTIKPSCSIDSNVHNKKKRLVTWSNNSNVMQNELSNLSQSVDDITSTYRQLSEDEDRYLLQFDNSKIKLVNNINTIMQTNSKLNQESKLLYDLCNKVCDNTSTNKSKKNLFMKDILDKLDELKHIQSNSFNELLKVSNEIEFSKLNNHPSNSAIKPIVKLSVDKSNGYLNNQSIPLNQLIQSNDSNDNISKLFSYLDETIKLNDININNIESYFLFDESIDRNIPLSEPLQTLVNSTTDWIPIPNRNQETLLAKPFLDMKNESQWIDYISELTNYQSLTNKRKRRINDVIDIKTNVHSRTPRDIKLIVSPLSQYEDRYLGTSTSNETLQYAFKQEEDSVLLKCRLQSSAAISDTKTRRLKNMLLDWKKIYIETKDNCKKSETINLSTIRDELNENLKIKNELIQFGIVDSDVTNSNNDIICDINIPIHYNSNNTTTSNISNASNNGAVGNKTNNTNNNNSSSNNSKNNNLVRNQKKTVKNVKNSNITNNLSAIANAASSLLGISTSINNSNN